MKTPATLLIALLSAAGMASALACEEDDGGNGVSDLRLEDVCEEYCSNANACDDETDIADCRSRCIDSLEDCMADEQEQAADDVENCAAESCDDFAACTIGAGLQCTFGI